MPGPAIAVAVVSWNTRELLVECLRALAPDVEAGTAEVWVVDNRSEDGSAAVARNAAPWATVLEPGENLGFGRAVNLVATRTATPWLMATNADVEVRPGTLGRLLATAQQDARAGAVAPALTLGDGRIQHSAYPFPTVAFTAMFSAGRQRLDRRWAERMCLEGYWRPDARRAVPWALGACLLLRRSAFDAVGGFDERQWVYAEDLDLGWRLADAGYRTVYEPAALVGHASGAATEIAFGAARRRRFMRETYAVIGRRRGVAQARLIAAINVAGVLARLAWMMPAAVFRRARRPAVRDAISWLAAHAEGLR